VAATLLLGYISYLTGYYGAHQLLYQYF